MDKINNLPDYASEYEYLVVRNCHEDGIWFYGAYHDFEKACDVALEIGNGVVIDRTYATDKTLVSYEQIAKLAGAK